MMKGKFYIMVYALSKPMICFSYILISPENVYLHLYLARVCVRMFGYFLASVLRQSYPPITGIHNSCWSSTLLRRKTEREKEKALSLAFYMKTRFCLNFLLLRSTSIGKGVTWWRKRCKSGQKGECFTSGKVRLLLSFYW